MSDQESEAGGAVFFSLVTASATHELKNHLALINEYNGLMGDFLAAHQKGAPLKLERMLTLTQQIKGQVAEGGRLLGQLNRFAHNLDQGRREIELGQELRVLADLLRRQMGLKSVGLEVGDGLEPLRISANPFALHQALHQLLLEMLDASSKGACLRLEAISLPQAAAVRLFWSQGGPDQTPPCAVSAALLGELGASLEAGPQGYTLLLPASGAA